MSADRADVVESLDAATEHVLMALEWTGGEDDATLELVAALVSLRVAKRQALEIREVTS